MHTTKPMRVGLIGTGRISDIYIKNCANMESVDIASCGSLNMAESQAKAEEYQIAQCALPEEIIQDPNIDAILNLTIPAAHAEVSMKALNAGKHVYSEKPFVTYLEDGRKVLDLAKERGLLVGNAPDTFFGGRWQTLRKAIDEGRIGTPTGICAFVPTPWGRASSP